MYLWKVLVWKNFRDRRSCHIFLSNTWSHSSEKTRRGFFGVCKHLLMGAIDFTCILEIICRVMQLRGKKKRFNDLGKYRNRNTRKINVTKKYLQNLVFCLIKRQLKPMGNVKFERSRKKQC